ncbi:SfnB family sulfur acquisition oxidoreductase [Methylocella sp. CPCC 101449]|jgi:SfnB family sulfur acquisition oxidoreductase|uniref:SfnB family sulfur acquisition oxidoreductase n=1 Tax=Methylocella sp. CPCC 101449 TaxID=2987531 RepID=UPI0028926871|nr:SfnB family sulfur acquisition oxidoreductase [Methylocella sp. CPCC 101449]MDT2021236.1 SfnB family sulfur acquisition oxidoreductase [Methylocella sp. CPCC 101449]HEV2572348.1 SfnB family sulfur acquisition oxidoreductase [Beijerinckiaceae bacterium]
MVSHLKVVASAPAKPSVHIISSDAEAIDVVERLAASFRTNAIARDQKRILPREEIEALTQAGVFGIAVPKEHGGADVSAATVAKVFRILSAADPSIGQIPQNHFCWVPTVAKGTAEQAAFFFKRFLAGDRIGNAHSEDTKRRPNDYVHDLRKVEGGWRITGRKYYSTGALFAQWIPFTAHFDKDGRHEAFIYFVDAAGSGIELIDDWDGMGQRLTASGTTIFTDVFVPDHHVFPMLPPGADGRSYSLNAGLIHAAIDLGIADEVLADAAHYIRENNRPWTGNPNAHWEEPFVVREFGKFGVKVRTAALVLEAAAGKIDHARAHPSEQAVWEARLAVADARLLCSEAATHIADQFFLLTGARATLGKYGLDRHWRNARTHSLHDPLRWKEFHLGNYYLNGQLPPPGSYL